MNKIPKISEEEGRDTIKSRSLVQMKGEDNLLNFFAERGRNKRIVHIFKD